ncbi:MAG TPA: L,D-transpeptidase, partial [Candidatus Saccharimonadales bacterium]|nr:L,D-transpeptidase [Candidatus Saccharimonadales bacterium]
MLVRVRRGFFYLVPVLMLLGVGVLVTTTRHFVPQLGCSVENYTEQYDKTASAGMYEGKQVDVPTSLADSGLDGNVLGDSVPSSRWIEINLSKQDLKAWDGNQLFLETPVSTGLPWFPTP